ncbi:MAG: hypothetical protein CMD26_00890, partial [Flavobacteriales bacterium]|nr:hypothetical protein [Flavobacteriales bacterium]
KINPIEQKINPIEQKINPIEQKINPIEQKISRTEHITLIKIIVLNLTETIVLIPTEIDHLIAQQTVEVEDNKKCL